MEFVYDYVLLLNRVDSNIKGLKLIANRSFHPSFDPPLLLIFSQEFWESGHKIPHSDLLSNGQKILEIVSQPGSLNPDFD